MSQQQSEQSRRVSRILDKATGLFEGDTAAAQAWLNLPCRALGDVPPLVVAATESGARAVENLIGQLEHGVFP